MKTKCTLFAILLLAVGSAKNLRAQEASGDVPVGSPYSPPASTPPEGALRGEADLGRSLGEYNYNTSLGAKIGEEAISHGLDNRLKNEETYFAMRQLNREARAAEDSPRLSAADVARINREKAPPRLDNTQFDRMLGSFN